MSTHEPCTTRVIRWAGMSRALRAPRVVILAIALGSSAAAAACVGNDPATSTSPPPGSDAATDATATADATGDASACAIAPAPTALPCTKMVACYDSASTLTCTASADVCAGDAGSGGSAHGCFSEKDCATGDVCCLQDGASYATELCPGTLDLSSSPSACGATLATGSGNCSKSNSPGDKGDAVLCATSAGCPAGQICYPVRLNGPVSLQGSVFGLCR